ncbi:peptide/nickel transport system ATP-binding protein/oligopeptide transport system ATP-binding protein [Hydrogenispora ethanolica]|uniref:Peptide/nickel transport system ATP-binding protein/oligopeptide transport system ATP-binding protein n=1 Tax=Hydrogenispora ethanolica TaxID=1082276 RepID=A0A4R1RZW0_HYDET|nr:ABC transporter ATP-binding protein [Hydrogenispora ethanolica]TCL72373.1 peptide/nickel transport system ATP-binding protein/oligopeptide transport system ATP-binding protein [Hydrogenispora ethanolica]
MSEKLLAIKNLKTYFALDEGKWVKAVDGVDLSVESGKTLCIVGESGCGKSITSLSIMNLIPKPPGKIVAGEILFEGVDLTKLSEDEMSEIRGNKIAMIFQEPMTSLNPVLTIGDQISEVLVLHRNMHKQQALQETVQMLQKVGIPRADKIATEYPHRLSGGMRQRAMIAMAMVCNPKLLIADEPTTALDVTIQAQVLDLMRKMKSEFGTAVIFITHDLGVVSEMADDVAVMYAGQVVETASVEEIFDNTRHPYTKALLAAIPFVDQAKEVLYSIPGTVPDAANYPPGCRFADRCQISDAGCIQHAPVLREITAGHYVRCLKAL